MSARLPSDEALRSAAMPGTWYCRRCAAVLPPERSALEEERVVVYGRCVRCQHESWWRPLDVEGANE